MKTYVPDKEMRTNPLSKTEGGSTVKIVKKHQNDKNCYEIIYENIKYPQRYIDKLKREDSNILEIYINNEITWKANSK
jgi:hypothetical protein